jgi:glycosyltransferase involved in cell wall biosynthesis
MSRVAILSLSVAPRDAVGNDVLHMQRLLCERGHEAVLFTSHWIKKSSATRNIADAEEFVAADPSSVLIYHHAIGWEQGVEVTCRAKCRRVVRYHNVTPPRFFSGYSTVAIKTGQEGRAQLAPLAKAGCELYLSASPFNQSELVQAGADPARCAVLPPFHQVDQLAAAEPDPEVLRLLQDGTVNLLFVGRRAPNKGHRFLLDAFAVYTQYYQPRARLLLVGREDPSLFTYGNQLREHARWLAIQDRVIFIQEATEAALRAYYQAAHAFVVTSEHEGFCVPVIEAMALRVPVIAYATSALPDTVGDAGLVWDEPDPFVLAGSVDCLVRQPEVRSRLAERGWQRFQERFSNPRIGERFIEVLGRLDRRAA